ncbi:unnamed protein product [Prorocentrum cordatum]|uniref:FACT complex subunit n=1 Tax=Prorocentrum cordatum TaxID=2364126 RepID=A0ABN9YG30_9DINO|nr:unnamed protein product [Polarella glacialis]
MKAGDARKATEHTGASPEGKRAKKDGRHEETFCDAREGKETDKHPESEVMSEYEEEDEDIEETEDDIKAMKSVMKKIVNGHDEGHEKGNAGGDERSRRSKVISPGG